MDASAIAILAKTNLDGSMPFPAIVGKLISNDVEYYHAFLGGKRATYFGRQGDHHVEWFRGAQPSAA
jgi:hypothetical protein